MQPRPAKAHEAIFSVTLVPADFWSCPWFDGSGAYGQSVSLHPVQERRHRVRERTLQGQAKLIGGLYQHSAAHQIKLPASYAHYYRDGIGEFAVLWADETLVAGSAGVAHGFHPIDPRRRGNFSRIRDPGGKAASYGISLKVPGSSPPAWVQVVFKDNEVIFDFVLEEFMQDIAWIWLPFVGILLVINLIVIRISLRPLARASAQASAIGPYRRLKAVIRSWHARGSLEPGAGNQSRARPS